MTRCQHCGQQVEEGKQFCPYCGKPAGGEVAEARQAAGGAESGAPAGVQTNSPSAAPRADVGLRGGPRRRRQLAARDLHHRRRGRPRADGAAALLRATPFAAARRAAPRRRIRADSPEFAQVRERLVVEFDADQNASESPRAIGDIVMFLEPTLRNLTGRTVESVELRASVVDLEGRPVKQRTVVRRDQPRTEQGDEGAVQHRRLQVERRARERDGRADRGEVQVGPSRK